MASGRSHGGLEKSKGMVGGGHGHLWTQCGEFYTNVGGETMVRCRGIRSAKRCAIHVLRGSGSARGTKRIIDDHDGGPECAAGRYM